MNKPHKKRLLPLIFLGIALVGAIIAGVWLINYLIDQNNLYKEPTGGEPQTVGTNLPQHLVTHDAMHPGGSFGTKTTGSRVDFIYTNPNGSTIMLVSGTGKENIHHEGLYPVTAPHNQTGLDVSANKQYATYSRYNDGIATLEQYFADSTTNTLFSVSKSLAIDLSDSSSRPTINDMLGHEWMGDYYIYHMTNDTSASLLSMNIKTGETVKLAEVAGHTYEDHWSSHDLLAGIQNDRIIYAISWSTFYKSTPVDHRQRAYVISIKPTGQEKRILASADSLTFIDMSKCKSSDALCFDFYTNLSQHRYFRLEGDRLAPYHDDVKR